eukprot:TRINITY_DN9212_c0_g1_i6.p1 TRINITY_DN9212_c0_g1~~TRINITY_DN9212_c0_g1_i6.p1  ORF type:complete len:104 (+),score=11.79 TRINITY_DN9212_c0_g1_i6:442-753(+)
MLQLRGRCFQEIAKQSIYNYIPHACPRAHNLKHLSCTPPVLRDMLHRFTWASSHAAVIVSAEAAEVNADHALPPFDVSQVSQFWLSPRSPQSWWMHLLIAFCY